MKITEDILFKYFRGKASVEEKIAISRWLEESEDNRIMFKDVSRLYEEFIMTAPASMFGQDNMQRTYEGGRRRARRLWYAAANAAAVAAVAICLWFTIDRRYERQLADSMITVEIPAGHRMDITLEDGTVARLNSGARLQYPKRFSSSSREVYLDGEACFDVTRDEKKPFRVNTFAAEIEVLGTNFDVYADKSENEFSTTLIEGKVKVTSRSNPEKSVIIAPDQKVSMNSGNLVVEAVDAGEEILWTDGILDITGDDFRKLIRKMENAYGVKIVIQRTEMPEIECMGGKVRISDGIEHALDLLSRSSGFQYINDRQNGTIYIR